MGSLPANASLEEIEEELQFHEVLISSLDPGADDYAERLEALEGTITELENRLAEASPREPTRGMDFWTDSADGRSSGGRNPSNGSAVAGPSSRPNALKRSVSSIIANDSEHRSKRPTPEPSNPATPLSATDSESSHEPALTRREQMRRQQLQAEEYRKKQREAIKADEDFARALSQQHGLGSSTPAPFAGHGVQTTLNPNGNYHRAPARLEPERALSPPRPLSSSTMSPASQSAPDPQYYDRQRPPLPSQRPVQAGPNSVNRHQGTPITHQSTPSTHVKAEPGSSRQPHQQQLVQRPRDAQVVDLTGSDSDEDVAQLVTPRHTPGNHMRPPYVNNPYYATPTTQQPVHRPNLATGVAQSPYVYGPPGYLGPQQLRNPPFTQNLLSGAVNGIRDVAGSLGQSLQQQVNYLMNGHGSFSRPIAVDDENGYSGEQQTYAGYSDVDLYNRRFDEIANYDPTKTREEINAVLENIRPDEDMPPHLRVETPEAMTVKLHKYQELGLTWLQKAEEGQHKGGILADDMGLGKTIQMLSLLVTNKSDDPRCKTTLIVAPVALMRQWKQEIEQKIKPGHHRLNTFIHHGPSKKKHFRDLQIYDVVLTTFGSLAVELKRKESLALRRKDDPRAQPTKSEQCALLSDEAKWYRVILDEAQCIKNSSTQTARAACELDAKFRFCLTGTPMMNNVDEFFSLLRFLRAKRYRVWEHFKKDISGPIQGGRYSEDDRKAAMSKLQAVCRSFMLRRTKNSKFEGKPILILPERTTDIVTLDFNEEQRAFYQEVQARMGAEFRRMADRDEVRSNMTHILVMLLRLRQACCHEHLLSDFGIANAADITQEEVLEFARQLDGQVVDRIKETGGNFECPVCYDGVANPAIFFPCGHVTCRECFTRITDPNNAIRDGNENGTGTRCPTCRHPIEPKRVTDFVAFKKIHMPELLTAEERDLDSDDDDDDDDEDSDDSDDVDGRGDLRNFVVADDNEDSTTESEAEEVNDAIEEGAASPSTRPANAANGGRKDKTKKKLKKDKKKKKKKNKEMTLAELKKESLKSKKMRQRYMRRLRSNWKSSAKIDKTMETLREIMTAPDGEKILIFSQWTSFLDLVEVPIDAEGWEYRRYDGSMNTRMRADAVDDFRDHTKNVRIMLVSLKAGNAGLNLNMASQVIILDPFWNPYIEEQAIDRAHRIGQARSVKVHRILVEDTVEDRIMTIQDNKRKLIDSALDEKAGQRISRLGLRELAYLFGVSNRH